MVSQYDAYLFGADAHASAPRSSSGRYAGHKDPMSTPTGRRLVAAGAAAEKKYARRSASGRKATMQRKGDDSFLSLVNERNYHLSRARFERARGSKRKAVGHESRAAVWSNVIAKRQARTARPTRGGPTRAHSSTRPRRTGSSKSVPAGVKLARAGFSTGWKTAKRPGSPTSPKAMATDVREFRHAKAPYTKAFRIGSLRGRLYARKVRGLQKTQHVRSILAAAARAGMFGRRRAGRRSA